MVQSNASDTPEALTVEEETALRIPFRPGRRLKKMIGSFEYEKVKS